jgi:mannosyltransferase
MRLSRTSVALVAIVLVGAALRLAGLGAEPFWLDEAHTANFTKLTVSELWSFEDPFDTVNPPGFILLMKIWTQVSRSDEWFRLLSALAGTATIPIVYAIGLRVANRRVGLFAAAFVALSGYLVRYSQEARAYALITLLAAMALWAVVQLTAEPEGPEATPWRRASSGGGRRRLTWTDLAWPTYGVAVGLSMHLHNTAVGIPLASNLAVGLWWLTVRPRPERFARNWIGANLLALVVWSPWLPGFLTQLGLVQANFWVQQPTVSSVTRDLGVLFEGYAGLVVPPLGELLVHALILSVAAVTMWWGSRSLSPQHRLVLWSFVLVQPAFQLVFSLRQPVFLSRTLLWILLACSVLLGLAWDRTGGRRLMAGAAALLLAVATLGTVGYHTGFEKTAWDEAADLVASRAGPDDVVFVLAGNTLVAFNRYFDDYDLDLARYRIPWDIPDRASRGAVLTSDDMDRLVEIAGEHDRVWLVLNSVGNIDGGEFLAPTLAARLAEGQRERMHDVEVVAFD